MKVRPDIGARVMRPYGRKEYTDYGEVGTVTAHGDGKSFTMTLDDYQPFARWLYGSKGKRTGHGAKVLDRLGPSEVEPLAEVYRENASRFRRVAEVWDQNAKDVEAGA